MTGRIEGNSKVRLAIRFCPVYPEVFKEQFTVQMGYFDPEMILIRGVGVYPSIIMTLPRLDAQELDRKTRAEVDKYSKEVQDYQRKIIAIKEAKKQPKLKEIKSLEQFKFELEREYDRNLYCDLIKNEISERENQGFAPDRTAASMEVKLY
jgi:hydrocephalus-inducing protein